MSVDTVTRLATVLEHSPWPGPRPLDPKGGHRLYGRDREVRELRQRLAQHRVVLFHALSGVGKTSLLRAGLYPALGRSGETVLLCAWGDLSGGDGEDPGAEFYAGALRSGLVEHGLLEDLCERYRETREHRGFLDAALEKLQEDSFKSPVLVFDQVEEVMRRDRPLAAAFFEEVEQVAFDYPDLAQIISFRTEYKAHVEVLDKSLAPSKIATTYELLPLSDSEVVAAIRNPADDWSSETGIPLAVDQAAAEELVAWLADARALQKRMETVARRVSEDQTADWARDIKELGESEVGLLHMQAVLDALFQRWASMEDGPPAVIDKAFLTSFRTRLVPHAESGRASAQVMVESLRQYVEHTFERASKAALPGLGADLGDFVRSLVEPCAAKMAGMLSSGGFKTAMDVEELGAAAVKALLEPLVVDQAWVGETVRSLSRAFGEGRTVEADDLAPLGVGANAPADGNPHALLGTSRTTDTQYVAGPARALGLSATQVESCAALAAAVAIGAMSKEQVLRKAPTSRQAIYELVHDGFGPALRSWAAGVEQRPRRRLDSPVTVLGEDVWWSEAEAKKEIDGSTLNGLRWVGCWVGTPRHEPRLRMSGLRFNRAELRGTVIEHAHLYDVKFVDCMLNGVLFRDCVMEDVTFAWSDENIPDDARNCDMLTFRDISTQVDAEPDAFVSSESGRACGPLFDNITIRNLSIYNASGLWRSHSATLEQVALDADREVLGTARFEAARSSLRQWRFGHKWRGTLRLDTSDIDLSVVYGHARIERTRDTRIGSNNEFNAVNDVVLDADPIEVLTTNHRPGRDGQQGV